MRAYERSPPKICETSIHGDSCDAFASSVILHFLNNMIRVLSSLPVLCVGGELAGAWEKVDISDTRDIFYNSSD